MSPRRSRKIQRGQPRRRGNPRILILCEGQRTEPNYFEGFKKSRNLASVVVRPLRSGQVGPTGLFKRVREELGADSGWDEIYCVLDHDGREAKIRTFQTKLAAVNEEAELCRIEMILSDPCFEFWLLLHFEFTDRPFSKGSHGTACEDVVRKLRRHLHAYHKNDAHVFEKCHEHVYTAIENAEKLQNAESLTPQSIPYTNVGLLIKRLLELSGSLPGSR